MIVLGTVIAELQCRNLPIFPCYMVYNTTSRTPIEVPLYGRQPYFTRHLVGGRATVFDRGHFLDSEILKCVNQQLFENRELFYDILFPYLVLAFVYNPTKMTALVQLRLDETKMKEHWDAGVLHPAVMQAPIMRVHLETLHKEFIVKVSDNIIPEAFGTSAECLPSTTSLFVHQREGLGWMTQLEDRISNREPVGQLFTGLPLSQDSELYWDGNRLTDTPGQVVNLYTQGGMIGDGIGSGKTLQMLTLIVNDLLRLRETAPVSADPRALVSNATLVVCGKQLAEQWRQQVQEHFRSLSLNVVCITDKLHHQRVTYETLLQADLVIVTMSFLVGEYYRDQFLNMRVEADLLPISHYQGCLLTRAPLQNLKTLPVLELVHFRRLVLDEADMYLHKLPFMDPRLEHAYNRRLTQHCRVNSSRKTEPFVYVQCLQSTFRWLVTSTANFTNPAQLAAFVAFLSLQTQALPHQGLQHQAFQQALQAPRSWCASGQPLSLDTALLGATTLELWLVKQAFLKHLLLARSQQYVFSSMCLPPLDVDVIWITYSDAERNLVRGALELDGDYDYHRHVHAFPHSPAFTTDAAPAGPQRARPMSVQEASEVMLGTQRARLAALEANLDTLRETAAEVDRVRQGAAQVLTNVLALRHQQVCQEIQTVENNIGAVQRSMQFLEASLQSREPCIICLDTTASTITACGHKFCHSCIERALREQPRCPTCRAQVSVDQCIRLLPTPSEGEREYGSRFTALLKYIREVRAVEERAQFVVFSEWEKELKKQSSLLGSEGGYRCAQIKGNTAVCQHHVEQFQAGEIDVLFLSLQSMASGLHLVTANHVIILTPLGAPFERAEQVERQAIGRCHRVGQRQTTHVRHILVRNSMEEEIWRSRRQRAGGESKE